MAETRLPAALVVTGIGVELFIALQLIFDRSRRKDFLAFALHFVFLIVGYYTIFGQNCDCFGSLSVPVSAVISWNLLALLCFGILFCFGVCQSPRDGISPSSHLTRMTTHLGISSGLVFVLLVYGNPLNLPISNGNDAVKILSSELGDIKSGTSKMGFVSVVNNQSHDINLSGGHASCSCVTTLKKYPICIPARSTVSIPIRVEISKTVKADQYRKTIVFFTDDQSCYTLKEEIGWRVAKLGS